jgi:hypothetical protein
MQPVIVMPMHDPAGRLFPHLAAVTPQLKTIFARAFVSVTSITSQTQARYIAQLEEDDFFQIIYHSFDLPVGDDFLGLYKNAAAGCHPNQVLHLCFIDRVAFALRSPHQAQFVTDVQAVRPEHTPLIFQRSVTAWDSHPRNYRELEQIVTRAGEFLFERSLDFAWCYLAVQAGQLQEVLSSVKNHDISMVAEIALGLKDRIQTRDVDWLAWEDPFIYSADPERLKQEREQSHKETRYRLAYIIPMLQLLKEADNEIN